MAALGTAPRVSDRAASHPEKSIKSAVAFTEAACEGVRPACRLKHRRARSHHSSMDSFRVRIVTSECGNDRANLWIDSANAGQDAGQEAEVDDADLVDKVDRLDSHTADAGRRSPSTHGKGLRGLDAQLVRAEGMLKNRGKSVNSQNRHLHDTCMGGFDPFPQESHNQPLRMRLYAGRFRFFACIETMNRIHGSWRGSDLPASQNSGALLPPGRLRLDDPDLLKQDPAYIKQLCVGRCYRHSGQNQFGRLFLPAQMRRGPRGQGRVKRADARVDLWGASL